MGNNTKHRPPKWADDFLSWCCAPEFLEEVQGDLHEAFHKRCQENGLCYARFLFVLDAMRSISFKTAFNPFNFSKNSAPMFSNYFTIGYRNLLRNKVFSFVNIFGLSIGMAACFLIMQYVHFEMSYDQFHESKDRIYRVTVANTRTGISAANHPATGPALKSEFPEVEDYARVAHQSTILGAFSSWSYDDGAGHRKVFNEQFMYDVDPSFITVFSFPFVYGDPQKALSGGNSIVISQTISTKFFGSEIPLGKTLVLDGFQSFTVTGVFKDVPETSHIKFNILMAYYMQAKWFDNNDWRWPEFYTYIKLKPFASASDFEKKLGPFASKFLGDQMKENNIRYSFHLQPLTDIHLKSPAMTKEREVHGSERTVYFLLIIAVLILIIAWINYINLSTSKAIDRAQEVGLRKVVGASKRQLVTQFLFEAAMINMLSVLVSFICVVLALPYFNRLSGKNIGNRIQDLSLVREPWFWLMLAGIFLLGSFIAGIYPAFILSSFKIVNAIKGKFFRSKSGITFRRMLVGFQFAISIALIAGTMIVFSQVSFMRNQEPGYLKNQLLIIRSPLIVDSTYDQGVHTFKTELARNPAILQVTASSEIPGIQIPQTNSLRNFNESAESNFAYYQMDVDEHFIDTYGIPLVAGRNYRAGERFSRQAKTNPIVLNQKAIEKLGFKNANDALHQLVYFGWGEPDHVGEIIGVVASHHQRSMRDDYDPIIFFYNADAMAQYITIRLNMKSRSETLAFIKDQYERAFPTNTYEQFFLDDYFDRQYASDQQFGKVFGLFSGLALVVAGLGLFGLCTFMISQRTKEIAIRKVLGATIYSMVTLFSKDFVRLILVANLIALPIVYVMVERWLDSFAFRINIGWLMFVIPAAILLLISLLTVSVQTIKTGSINPVKSLRSE